MNLSLLLPVQAAKFALAATWTALLATIAVIGVSLGSWLGDHTMPRVWLRVVLWIYGVRVDVRGAERRRPGTRYVYAAHHESILDGMALVVALDEMPRFVGKRQIARIPVIGLAWKRLGHILIDRDRPRRAYATLTDAAEDIGDVYSVYFAPRGTRARDGEVGPWKAGAFVYAQAAGLAVMPVAIVGAAALWPPGTWRIAPGRVLLEFGPPLAVDDIDQARAAALAWTEARVAALRADLLNDEH